MLVAWFGHHPTAQRLAKAALEQADIVKFEEPEPNEGERLVLEVGRACIRDAARNEEVRAMLERLLERSNMEATDTAAVKRGLERLSIRLRQSAQENEKSSPTTQKPEANSVNSAE